MTVPAAGGGPVVLAAAGFKTLALTGISGLKGMLSLGASLIGIGALLARRGRPGGEPAVLDAGRALD